MDIWTLLIMAVGLAMDAFAVSISSGIIICHAGWRRTAKIAGSFGFFQGLMPLVGYLLARTFADKIASIDHWVAFILLAFIGGKMLWEVFRGKSEEELPPSDPCNWKNLLVMSIATSIDALAVGASLAVMPHDDLLALPYGYLLCCAIIAVTTFIICFAGVKIGCRTGNWFGRKAEIVGGVVLIGIGLKIFLEHMGVFDMIGQWFK